MDRPPSHPSPPPSAATTSSEASSEPQRRTSRVLQRLLAMADSYYHDGAINQAQEIYFDLITNHGDSVEASLAEERLMALARLRELAGEPRAARAIYDRLLKLNS